MTEAQLPVSQLPVEHELINGAVYTNKNGHMARWVNRKGFEPIYESGVWLPMFQPLYRQGPVARYEKSAPPVKQEPEGLGAVVRDAQGFAWTHADGKSTYGWVDSHGSWRYWTELPHPVEILSEGVVL